MFNIFYSVIKNVQTDNRSDNKQFISINNYNRSDNNYLFV